MPKRPKQHELEDLSRAKFQLCLPKKWVFRDKDKDYGIDGEIELFDEDGNSQGLLFYVQLKATGSKKNSEILNINFKIETLEYFKQLEIPVLLARYSEYLDRFYIKWINDVDLTFAKKNAKTFRIKIIEHEVWTDKTSTQIENVLTNVRLLKSGSFEFPISYSIDFDDIEIQDLSNSLFKIKLRNKLNDYSDFLDFKKSEENFLVQISIKQNVLLVQPIILKGVYFHNIDKGSKESFVEDLSLDILLSLSMCMVMLGQVDYAGKIIFENNLEERLIEKEELMLMIIPPLISSSYFKNTLELIDYALDKTENVIILFPAIVSLLLQSKTKNKNKIKQIESFFKSQLNKSKKLGIDSLIATSHYNLGNFYRSKDKHHKSISHYVKAKKYDTNYLKRPYYYQEIAGVCFEAGKFWFSSKFYKKSIELGASNDTKSLLGDVLMFSGEYEKADKIFAEYISDSAKPNEEFLLKAILLQNIIEERKIKSQKRKPKEANVIAGNKPTLNDIEKAFDHDLLSSLAWFNLGMLKEKENNSHEATLCFAMCACINLWDVEAWTFAFLSFINSGKEEDLLIGSLILKTAYYHNRDEFLMHLYGILEKDNESNKGIITMIDNILINDNIDENKSAILRILGKDAEFKEIKVKK